MKDIKRRLKDAYENVEFYASNTWSHNPNSYQRVNQELFVRESKLKDSFFDELTRPRTVRDSIPNSKLAQYSNYEYNESRELSYASSAGNISFHYPCVYKRKSNKEPWMLPEIEQLFIWFSYPPKFDILEALKLEELNHFDEQDQFGYKAFHRLKDFHEIFPMCFDTFERTPGKSRYKSCLPLAERDLLKYNPTVLKIDTFEDMILRMKIKSEKVQYLWSEKMTPKLDTIKEKNVNVYKSPLGNYFLINENNVKNSPRVENPNHNVFTTTTDFSLRKEDCNNLQNLYAALQSLENVFLNVTSQIKPIIPKKEKKDNKKTENVTQAESTPTRRLYSAVLQGLPTDKNTKTSTDTSPSSSIPTKDLLSSSLLNTTPNKTSSALSTNNSSLTVLTPVYKSTPILSKSLFPSLSSSSNWFTSSSSWSTSQTKSFNQVHQENFKPANFEFNYTSKFSVSQKLDNFKSSKNALSFPACNTSFLDPCLSNSIQNVNSNTSTNSSFLNYPTDYLENASSNHNISNSSSNTDSNSSNVCFSTLYGTNSFYNLTCLNSQIAPHHQSNSFTELSVSNSNLYTSNSYLSNQTSVINAQNLYSQYNRQPYPSISAPPPTSTSPPPPPPPPPLPTQPSNQMHISAPHSMWIMPQNRPPSNVYSLTHFSGQPFLYLPSAPTNQTPITQPSRQNQRWTSHSTHYIRTPTTLQSYQYPMTPHNSSSSPSQPWGMANQNLYRTNSNHHISCTSQHYVEQKPGLNLQGDSKSQKCSNVVPQSNFLQQNTRTSSTDYWISENYDIRDVYCDTYTREFSKQSTCSSDMAFSLSPSEKATNVKHVASTPSLDFRRLKSFDCNDIKKKPSPTSSVSHRENPSYYERHLQEEHKLVPVIDPFADELERQALEQYQPSNENFYQELERQAKEQYDEDHSENLMSPPHKLLLFGGLLELRNLILFSI